MKDIRIATRASKLALIQANYIKQCLTRHAPGTAISVVHISTKGDKNKSDFLYKAESVGFFTSEVENAVLSGQADLAVHSLKDLPTAITPGLIISAIPPREQVADVVIAARHVSSINELPPNAVVGTSSLRRIRQLKGMRPDLDCQPLRGNVESRIRRVDEGQLDAIVIAQAGVNRLEMSDKVTFVLSPEDFVPAPGQGALAVQTRKDDPELCRLAAQLDDAGARLTAQTERHILAGLHGGCSIPLGVYARIEHKTIHIHAVLCSVSDDRQIRKSVSCPIDQAVQTADILVKQILNEGGREILQEIQRQKSS